MTNLLLLPAYADAATPAGGGRQLPAGAALLLQLVQEA